MTTGTVHPGLLVVDWSSVLPRFWARVSRREETDCWPWIGARIKGEYGQISINGKMEYAHRVSFFIAYGYWPPDHTDHLCRNKWCVNPRCLEAVSRSINTKRGLKGDLRNTLTCRQGHIRTPENTYIQTDGTFRCKICANNGARAHKARKKAKNV